MKEYWYRDHAQEGRVIFKCMANTILEADELYREATGSDPSKQAHIGCEFSLAEEWLTNG